MLQKIFKYFRTSKPESIFRFQFYVIRKDRCGYRINRACQAMSDTPQDMLDLRFIDCTYSDALKERQRLLILWQEKYGEPPEDMMIQEYVNI